MSGASWVLVAGGYGAGALENIQDAIREYLAAVEESLKNGEVREVEVTI